MGVQFGPGMNKFLSSEGAAAGWRLNVQEKKDGTFYLDAEAPGILGKIKSKLHKILPKLTRFITGREYRLDKIATVLTDKKIQITPEQREKIEDKFRLMVSKKFEEGKPRESYESIITLAGVISKNSQMPQDEKPSVASLPQSPPIPARPSPSPETAAAARPAIPPQRPARPVGVSDPISQTGTAARPSSLPKGAIPPPIPARPGSVAQTAAAAVSAPSGSAMEARSAKLLQMLKEGSKEDPKIADLSPEGKEVLRKLVEDTTKNLRQAMEKAISALKEPSSREEGLRRDELIKGLHAASAEETTKVVLYVSKQKLGNVKEHRAITECIESIKDEFVKDIVKFRYPGS
jgi:hypothetical protein